MCIMLLAHERSSTITIDDFLVVSWLTLTLNTNDSEQLQNTIVLLFSILPAHTFLKNEQCKSIYFKW